MNSVTRVFYVRIAKTTTAGLSVFEIMEGVSRGSLRPPIPEDWPEDLRRVIEGGWHQDPSQRPTAAQLHTQITDLAKFNFEDL